MTATAERTLARAATRLEPGRTGRVRVGAPMNPDRGDFIIYGERERIDRDPICIGRASFRLDGDLDEALLAWWRNHPYYSANQSGITVLFAVRADAALRL